MASERQARRKSILVKDLMTAQVQSCRAEDTLQRAAQLMWEGDIGCVPVIDDQERIVGIVTDRDVCMAAYTQGTDLASRNVACAMSKQVHTCGPADSVAVAEERMRQTQVRRLPVVKDGRLIGMLSLNDLATAAGDRKTSQSGGIGLDEVATTLCRIGEHRSRKVAAE